MGVPGRVGYSAGKTDLFFPAKRGEFFPNGRPKSDAALCVEMARLAYFRGEVDFAFDQDGVRKVLNSIEFGDCKFFESAGRPNTRGSHAFLALDTNAKLAVLAFRGTDSDDPTDISDDCRVRPENWVAGGKVHEGFAGALLEIWDGVQKEPSIRKDFRLLFTGHSLGAAMATLAASLQKPAALYTFGSPRVGDADFVAILKGVANFRYVDCCDLVPRIPPEGVLGYTHLGRPYYIACDRTVQQRDPDDPFIREDRIRAELEYLEQCAWQIGNDPLRPLADHAPVNYVWPVTAASL